MATIAEKYNTLNSTTTNGSTPASQLIWPVGYDTTTSEHPGHVLVFEFSRISGQRLTNEKGSTGTTTKTKIKGAYGQEVAQNGVAGATSLRNKATQSIASASATSGSYGKTNQSIVLPFTNVTMTDSAQWVNSDLGDIGRALDFGASVLGDNWQLIEQTAKDSGMRVAAGALQALSGSKVLDYLELKSGVLSNPYSEVLFRGMNNRVIPLKFELHAKNAQEAAAIQSIIHRFRFHQRPEMKYQDSGTGNASYLIAPSVVDISAISLKTGKQIPWFPLISTCAITSVDVDYTPMGVYSAMTDEGLGHVNLSIIFEELTLPTKEAMADVNNSF